MDPLRKFIGEDIAEPAEIARRVLEKVEDGALYTSLPLYTKTIEESEAFHKTYGERFPLFVVAAIKVGDKYIAIRNKNREGIEFVGGKAEELNFRKAIEREMQEEINLNPKLTTITPKALILNQFKTPLGEFWHFGVGFLVKAPPAQLTPLPSEVREILLLSKEELKGLSFTNSILVELSL